MYILGIFKVLDDTRIFLLLLYKYTPIWWKILGHIQLPNSIYCCFEYVFINVSAKLGCSKENKKAILVDFKRTKKEILLQRNPKEQFIAMFFQFLLIKGPM